MRCFVALMTTDSLKIISCFAGSQTNGVLEAKKDVISFRKYIPRGELESRLAADDRGYKGADNRGIIY